MQANYLLEYTDNFKLFSREADDSPTSSVEIKNT